MYRRRARLGLGRSAYQVSSLGEFLNRDGDGSALCLGRLGSRIEEVEGVFGHGGWMAMGREGVRRWARYQAGTFLMSRIVVVTAVAVEGAGGSAESRDGH
jgi:hypothetical protein